MNDVQLLFVVLAFLYGWECACWVRRGGLAFVTWLGRHWSAQQPGALVGNQRGGFIFVPPLPPLGTLFTARPFPLSISPEGVLAFVSTNVNPGFRPAQIACYLAFTDIKEIRAKGKKLMLNGEAWLKLSASEPARQLAENLDRVWKAKPAEREKQIAAIFKDSFDHKAIADRWQLFREKTSQVRLLTNAVFTHLFIVVPVIIWQFGLKANWLPLLAMLLTLTISIAVFFRGVHKLLYPAAEDERFTHTLTIALAPATSIRALDQLSRHLFESFHPLAVAQVLLTPERFREFARPILLDLRYPALPVVPEGNPAATATELHARTLLRKTAEDFLKRNKVEPDELCQPPKPTDETCRTYCPRCGAQFTTPDAVCSDCGGMPVVAFASVKSAALKSSSTP